MFIQENAFEDDVWKIAAILSWPQCVKSPPNLSGRCDDMYFIIPR